MSWKPTEDFVMCFSDETAEPRTEEQFNTFVEELRVVANKYDFDISRWGGGTDMRESFVRLQEQLNLFKDV